MKFIHTADWHLGRLFHGVHLTADQRHVLNQIVDLAREVRPDLIIMAGDVYDRAVPPPEAVELLDEVLSKLVLDLKIPVVLIAGNHDSPGRLHFGSRLLAGRRLYVTGTMSAACEPLVMDDGHGPLHIYAVPYAEPATVRGCFAEVGRRTSVVDEAGGKIGAADASSSGDTIDAKSEGADQRPLATPLAGRAIIDPDEAQTGETKPFAHINDHDAAMRATLDRVRSSHPANVRAILVAHAFVAGAAGSESERPLSVGGAGTVSTDCLYGFDYVALGHLHRSQAMDGAGRHGCGPGTIRYCGSPLKYSFDEADGPKSVQVVEMGALGVCSCETVQLMPRHDVRKVEGTMADLLARPDEFGPARDDYLQVTLLDDGPVVDAIGRLREVFPNVLNLIQGKPRTTEAGETEVLSEGRRMAALDHAELFKRFYAHVSGAEPTEEQRGIYATVVEEMERREREVV